MTPARAATQDNRRPDSPLRASFRRQCIDQVLAQFPFKGMMDPGLVGYDAIAKNCATYLPVGSRILDYGAGPCDKTAVLSYLGYNCTAIDDLGDDWHQLDDNRSKIIDFARSVGVNLLLANRVPDNLPPESFDMVMTHDVIEHFSDSPRPLLLRLIELLRPGGYLYVTVPNAVNLRKRLLVIGGKTNYPRYPAYFWSGSIWRGHKREYVKDDLSQLCHYLGLKKILLKGQTHRLGAIPKWARGFYLATAGRIDSFRETLALIGQKEADWKPVEISPEIHRQIRQKETSYQYD